METLLGAVADNFTRVTDLANTLVRAGMPTIQTFVVRRNSSILEMRLLLLSL